jgi:hypothetical protein
MAPLMLESLTLLGQTDHFPSTVVKQADYRLFRSASAPFTVEYPKKDWQMVPGFGTATVLFTTLRGDAMVGIEDVMLSVPLSDDDIGDTFIKYETDDVKRMWPAAQSMQTTMLKADAGPVVVIDFKQDAALGPQQIRQFSLPRKDHLYRVTCVSLPTSFPRYLPICEHIATTLKYVPPSS